MNKKKQYKARKPEDTVKEIRKILGNWNIFLKESSNEDMGLSSCRLILDSPYLSVFNIGTNGKGRSYAFSLASGYAEFIERLQNRILLDPNVIRQIKTIQDNNTPCALLDELKKEGIRIEYVYDPNELYMSYEEFLSTQCDEVKYLCFKDSKQEERVKSYFDKFLLNANITLVPFFDILGNKQILLPIEVLYYLAGSNGMCAGNTHEEAFLQGICEIFERYAIRQIFFNRMSLPSVDLEEFAGTVAYDKILKLQSNGYNVKILDGSLGVGLPVIGIIITNNNKTKYNVKFGSDFVLSIALERCLTEVFQSSVGFHGVPTNSAWADEMNSFQQFEEFNKILTSGSGVWPSSIFNTSPSSNSLKYSEEYGLSNESDIHIALELVNKLGYKIFVKDFTASEIPSMFIFIPEMSVSFYSVEHFMHANEILGSEWYAKLDDFENCSLADKEMIYNSLQQIPFSAMNNIDLSIFSKYDINNDMQNMSLPILLLMLSYYFGNDEVAISVLEKLSQIKSPYVTYFTAAQKFIRLKANKTSGEDITKILSNIFLPEVVADVVKDFSEPKQIFSEHHLSEDISFYGANNIGGLMEVARIIKKINDSFAANNKSGHSLHFLVKS